MLKKGVDNEGDKNEKTSNMFILRDWDKNNIP